jgi:hypothetical protein
MNYSAQLAVGIAMLLLYLWLVIFAASNYIQAANRRWLEAHEAALLGRLKAAPGVDCAGIEAAVALLLPGTPGSDSRRWGLFSPSQWIGSCEIARWVRLHEAQRLEVQQMSEAAVRARFARAMGQIDELSAIRQNAWQHRWVDLQTSSRGDGRLEDKRLATWRDELSQLLAELFNARDSTYNQLVSLYGKAGLLIFAAYLPVLALLCLGYGPALLAGFLGGLISRMQRLVYAPGRPTAYGTSWVPLFLAPLLGSLAAWAGLHLLVLMKSLGVVSLDDILVPGVNLTLAPSASVLGLAVLFGFSERFFNQLGDQAEKIVTGNQEAGSAAAAGSPTSAPPMRYLGATPSATGGERDEPHERPLSSSRGSARVRRPHKTV